MAETTHIICAHCGKDHTISNAVPPNGTLLLVRQTVPTLLIFRCQECKVEYPLPLATQV